MPRFSAEGVSNRLATFSVAQALMSLANRVPIAYRRARLRVGDVTLSAHTFDRYLALWLWKLGFQETRELRLLRKLCQPGMRVLDIGANIGVVTLHLARFVGEQGHVWAFEPDPGNFGMLQANIEANACRHVTALQLAIGAKSETQTLYVSTAHHGDHRLYASPGDARKSISVSVVALDDFLSGQPGVNVIKMDVQGSEGMALAGMNRMLQHPALTTLVMEFWPDALRRAGSEPIDVLAKLQKMGFQLATIGKADESLCPIGNVGDFTSALGQERSANILARK